MEASVVSDDDDGNIVEPEVQVVLEVAQKDRRGQST